MSKPIVALVGRPNVGKSTLFNRLTESRQAIVNEQAGTTRDRQYGKVEWGGQEFSIIDTGGWVVNSDDVFEEEINKQVGIAMEEADVILFVVDVISGITDLDEHVAKILRRRRIRASRPTRHRPVGRCAELIESGAGRHNLLDEGPRQAVVDGEIEQAIVHLGIWRDQQIFTGERRIRNRDHLRIRLDDAPIV